MIHANHPDRGAARLLTVDARGRVEHRARSELASLLLPGDLVVANDAATLPASLSGVHEASGAVIEVRLAGWKAFGDPTRFTAVLFGEGDYGTRTEDRPPPRPLRLDDVLLLGPLTAIVERILGHPRLVELRFTGTHDAIWAGIARHGKPIQYAHVPEPLALWDTWTSIAAQPAAFEAPSAGFALDWSTLQILRTHGVAFATLTHAAGISSTGDPVLDRILPFDEFFRIPRATAIAVARTRSRSGRVVAIGTTVVRALEAAADSSGRVSAGDGVAHGRIGPRTRIRGVDAILSGAHDISDSHYDLLRAFADEKTLAQMSATLDASGYRSHEFGDSVFIERSRNRSAHVATQTARGTKGASFDYSTTPMIGPKPPWPGESLRLSSGA